MKSRYFYVILAMYCGNLWDRFSDQTCPVQSENCTEYRSEPTGQSHENDSIQDLDIVERIVEDIVAKKEFPPDQQENETDKLRQALQSGVLNTSLSRSSYRIARAYFELEVQRIRSNADQDIRMATLSVHGNLMEIHWEVENGQEDFAAVAFILYNDTDLIDMSLDMQNGTKPEVTVVSDVATAIIRTGSLRIPSQPIRLTFQNNQKVNGCVQVQCVNLNGGMNLSNASSEDCETEHSNMTHTVCSCKQGSTFAVLVRSQQIKDCYSSILTDIGIFASLLCVAITLFTLAVSSDKNPVILLSLLLVELSVLAGFDVFGHVVGSRNHFKDTESIVTITALIISEVCLMIMTFIFTNCSLGKGNITNSHLHLCLNLFLGNMLFITQSDRVCNKTVCAITAGWLHYFYLTVFAWMFLEGVQLCIMSVNLRKMRVSNYATVNKYKIPFCYLAPAVIVAVSAATNPDGYGSPPEHCWLQKENIWYFSGPVLLIILINMILFAKTFWILNEQLTERNVEVSKIKDTRMLTFKALLQLVILGTPWIIGYIKGLDSSHVLDYIFNILITLQGVLIFLILCVFSPEVRKECKKWFARTIQKHNTSTTSVSPATNVTESVEWSETSTKIAAAV